MRCKLSSRKTLALCLLGGMSGAGAGPLALLGLSGKNNKTVVNNRPNINSYVNVAIQAAEMRYNACLKEATEGGMFKPSVQSCLQELIDNQDQFMELQIKREAKQMALVLKQRTIKDEMNLKLNKANINKEIAILSGRGRLENAKQISKLKNRARTIENQLNKYGGAITKGAALYASRAGVEITGGAVGAFGAGALKTFMNQSGLNKIATALVLTAAMCAASIAMVATARTTVVSIFSMILKSIHKLIKFGTMPPMMIIKKLLGTTRTYVNRTRENRSQTSIQQNVNSVAPPQRSVNGSSQTSTRRNVNSVAPQRLVNYSSSNSNSNSNSNNNST